MPKLEWLFFGVMIWISTWSTSVLSSQTPGQGTLFASRGAIVPLLAPEPQSDEGPVRASLFAGREAGGLFAPVTRAQPQGAAGRQTLWSGLQRQGAAGLRDLIASVEAGVAGYDAVVWSAKIKTPKPPTHMTLAEIYHWIDVTPGQNHAIGRYQFIPSTLRRLVALEGVPLESRFSPEVQNRLANVLLEDAGFSKFVAGELTRAGFMNNLAKIWAGLPNSTGKSHYHGVAGNKAVISWARFDTAMARIFPG